MVMQNLTEVIVDVVESSYNKLILYLTGCAVYLAAGCNTIQRAWEFNFRQGGLLSFRMSLYDLYVTNHCTQSVFVAILSPAVCW